jgi:two-component system, sensor histidine kinase
MIRRGESKSEIGGPGSEVRDPARLAMDQALAIVVHEMRSPIGVIRNAVDILRLSPPADPVVEQQYRAIERHVGHLGRLVGDLLDLTLAAHWALARRSRPCGSVASRRCSRNPTCAGRVSAAPGAGASTRPPIPASSAAG